MADYLMRIGKALASSRPIFAIAVFESPHITDMTFVRTEGTDTVRAFLVVAGSFRVLDQEASVVPVIAVAAIDAGPVMS
jgi:hypothetical protein